MENIDENINSPTDSPQTDPAPATPSPLPSTSFGVPQAILMGMVIIAASIYVSFGVPNYKAVEKLTLAPPAPSNPGNVLGTAAIAGAAADDDPVLGNENAPVTLIEFSDFQCPFCRKLWRETLPQLKRDYIDTGKVKLVYRDFPLPSLHPMAELSAQAGECADEQGRFWDMHDKVFAEQDKLGENTVSYTVVDLKNWASEIGLNTSQFDTCIDSGKYRDEVAKDISDGASAGIQGTPGTFVNGKLVSGAQPYDIFKTAIDEALD